MDITTVARVSGLPIRTLRYVLEHGVLPNGDLASQGRRVTRSFTGSTCFAIAIAAALIQAGQRRSVVADCLSVICKETKPLTQQVNCPLVRAYGASGRTTLQIGDGVNVRVEAVGGFAPFDTGWFQASTGVTLNKSYDPFVLLTLNVGRLRDPIRKAAER